MDSKTLFNGNVIDLEASGMASSSYPIEVGIVLGDGQQYQALIKPLPHWLHWDLTAQRLHGISRTQLQCDGLNVQTVCHQVNQFCAGQVLYSDCWTADFRWLNLLFAEAGVKMDFFCRPMEYFLSEGDQCQWLSYRHQYRAENKIRSHRALNDAILMAHTLERYLRTPLLPSYYAKPELEYVGASGLSDSSSQTVA